MDVLESPMRFFYQNADALRDLELLSGHFLLEKHLRNFETFIKYEKLLAFS